jgi:hypothetical protein
VIEAFLLEYENEEDEAVVSKLELRIKNLKLIFEDPNE